MHLRRQAQISKSASKYKEVTKNISKETEQHASGQQAVSGGGLSAAGGRQQVAGGQRAARRAANGAL